MPKADGVFEGGGIKGIGLVGALTVAEQEGYTDWRRVAGTSAGAIVASLLAAGYSARELKEIMMEMDYLDLLDYTGFWDVLLHPIDATRGVIWDYGVNRSSPLREWLDDKLSARGVKTFADLRTGSTEEKYRYGLRIIASDISDRNMIVLPQEVKKYGQDPDELRLARAVEMSVLFPGFFKPEELNGSYVIDGGILSNFPVWLFDRDEAPEFPTFGFKLLEKEQRITGPITFLKEIFYTMLEGHDNEHQEESNSVRTIPIPSSGISPLSFKLTDEEKRKLFESGQEAARKFFKGWSFKEYRKKFRE
ncbi:patatin-like phospholipase family protein [Candidatus Bipolaricaulota bacterium]|nr:patatin-like phospholipase family protein [Candidatus Bipolaricaulota bacterium]